MRGDRLVWIAPRRRERLPVARSRPRGLRTRLRAGIQPDGLRWPIFEQVARFGAMTWSAGAYSATQIGPALLGVLDGCICLVGRLSEVPPRRTSRGRVGQLVRVSDRRE